MVGHCVRELLSRGYSVRGTVADVRELGWAQRPVRESIIDNAEDLIAHGTVAPVRGQ